MSASINLYWFQFCQYLAFLIVSISKYIFFPVLPIFGIFNCQHQLIFFFWYRCHISTGFWYQPYSPPIINTFCHYKPAYLIWAALFIRCRRFRKLCCCIEYFVPVLKTFSSPLDWAKLTFSVQSIIIRFWVWPANSFATISLNLSRSVQKQQIMVLATARSWVWSHVFLSVW